MGKEILKILKIYYDSPERLLSKVINKGGMLHIEKRKKLIGILKNKIKEQTKSIYYFLIKEGKGKLTNWQKIKIKDAVDAYKDGFYDLTMVSLKLATIGEEEISKEAYNVKRINEEGEKIDLEQMISNL